MQLEVAKAESFRVRQQLEHKEKLLEETQKAVLEERERAQVWNPGIPHSISFPMLGPRIRPSQCKMTYWANKRYTPGENIYELRPLHKSTHLTVCFLIQGINCI